LPRCGFLGPKRYRDLLDGLPGIGTNLLADRLKALERAGIVRRAVLPPPAGSAVYVLTELGRGLESTVFELVLSQQLSPSEAVATGSVQLDGEQAALDRFVALFAWPSPATVLAG
jgi:DNA-binding HxlR family transcriptional regulator